MKERRLIGAMAVGLSRIGKEIRIAQMLIEKRAEIPPEMLTCPTTDLKKLLKMSAKPLSCKTCNDYVVGQDIED
ncbi:hypothetical protein L4D09_04030 [Photobacterium makurazakiensis]